jgi:hypothetical protein
VSSVGLRLKCDCSGKAQKQFNSKLQTRSLVGEDALKAERRNCQTKEEQDKIRSRVPEGVPIPGLTGRLSAAGRTPTPTPAGVSVNSQQWAVSVNSVNIVHSVNKVVNPHKNYYHYVGGSPTLFKYRCTKYFSTCFR